MRFSRGLIVGLTLAGLVFPVHGQALPLMGYGPGAAGGAPACVPVTLPGGAIYQSLALTDAGWTPSALSLSTNALASPACAVSGAKLTEDTSNGGHFIFNGVSAVTAVQVYTLTTYYQRASGLRNIFHGVDSSGFGSSAAVGVDLSNCTINIAATVSGGYTLPSAVITGPFIFNGASWCKVVLMFTGIVDTGFNIIPQMMNGVSTSYAGDGSSAIGIWGVDLR